MERKCRKKKRGKSEPGNRNLDMVTRSVATISWQGKGGGGWGESAPTVQKWIILGLDYNGTNVTLNALVLVL